MRRVVIGAAYGDEGKGNVVNALADCDTLVVRFNGGAQAGHTVHHEGRRHIFSHFGAGTLKGARTHLMSEFVCFPRLFMKELAELHPLTPKVTVSPYCRITTPFDVHFNRMREQRLGHHRHGSVGIGFGETIGRNEYGFTLTMADVAEGWIYDKLVNIYDRYVPLRKEQLRLEHDIPIVDLDSVVEDCMAFRDNVTLQDDGNAIANADDIIFEGAQGLQLDMTYGSMPHVTRSHTGLRGLRRCGITVDEVLYVTRAYTTRHGAGPFLHALPGPPYAGIVDQTNLLNDWQGALRYSYLNLRSLRAMVARDGQHLRSAVRSGVMTCLDQVDDPCTVILPSGRLVDYRRDIVPDIYRRVIKAKKVYVTDGPAATGLYQNEQLRMV